MVGRGELAVPLSLWKMISVSPSRYYAPVFQLLTVASITCLLRDEHTRATALSCLDVLLAVRTHATHLFKEGGFEFLNLLARTFIEHVGCPMKRYRSNAIVRFCAWSLWQLSTQPNAEVSVDILTLISTFVKVTDYAVRHHLLSSLARFCQSTCVFALRGWFALRGFCYKFLLGLRFGVGLRFWDWAGFEWWVRGLFVGEG
jgi:hypothetical protein